jgi:hypothetical protein
MICLIIWVIPFYLICKISVISELLSSQILFVDFFLDWLLLESSHTFIQKNVVSICAFGGDGSNFWLSSLKKKYTELIDSFWILFCLFTEMRIKTHCFLKVPNHVLNNQRKNSKNNNN